MPNWCSNVLRVTGSKKDDDDEDLGDILNDVQKPLIVIY